MKTKVLTDQPVDFLEALQMLQRGFCVGIQPNGFTRIVVRSGHNLVWEGSTDAPQAIITYTGIWYPVIEAPKTATIEITEEEAEELAKFLEYAESKKVKALVSKFTNPFKEETP